MGRRWTRTSLDREEFGRQYLAGVEAGAAAAAVGPRAASARYDDRTRTLILQLRDGSSVAVPIRGYPELAGLSDDVIGTVRVTSSGYGLHWDCADIHLAVPAVIDAVRRRG